MSQRSFGSSPSPKPPTSAGTPQSKLTAKKWSVTSKSQQYSQAPTGSRNPQPGIFHKSYAELAAKRPGAYTGSTKLPAGGFFVRGRSSQAQVRSVAVSNVVQSHPVTAVSQSQFRFVSSGFRGPVSQVARVPRPQIRQTSTSNFYARAQAKNKVSLCFAIFLNFSKVNIFVGTVYSNTACRVA